jgi:hypothetical protein
VLLLVPLLMQDLRSYLYYESSINEVGLHGRYLYGGHLGVAVAAAVGCRRLLPRGGRAFVAALAVALAVQLEGLRALLERPGRRS